MKKFLALMLSLIMITSFCACGKEQNAEKYCFNCGKAITENASFCEHCGANIKEHLAQTSSGTSTNATSTTASATSKTTSTASTTSKTTASSKPTISTTTSGKPTSSQFDIQQKIKNMGENITVLIPGSSTDVKYQLYEQRYSQLCGGKIDWVTGNGYSELQQKLASMHMSDEAPDVYYFSNQDYPSILYKGILAPLDGLIDLNHKVFDNNKAYINGLRWEGKCYLIPEIGTTRDLLVNKKILTNAGVPKNQWPDAQYKAGTWTWDSMLSLIKKVSNANTGIYGFASGNNLLYAFASSTGTDFVKRSGTNFVSNVKSNEITRAMNMMKTIITNPSYTPTNSASNTNLFKENKICLYYERLELTSDSKLGTMLKNGEIFFAPFPRDPKVNKTYKTGDICGLSIPASAKHVKGATAYILAHYASDDYTNAINDLYGSHNNWNADALDYYENLMKREAVLCFSLGIKEIQTMLWSATSTNNLASIANWEAISTELNSKMQQELDMLG
ncbi:MAG: extracellular solute-binding protein [Ruminococcaceae bacterium]|nr:extracellular solute-binding protein [Oscillospiraceae bacterium]